MLAVTLVAACVGGVAGAEGATTGSGGNALNPIAPGGRTITVTTTTDGGPGSLRQSIEEAQPGDTIVLPGGTYVLTEGELEIDKALTIAGAGAARTTIDGGDVFRAFLIRTPRRELTPVTISGVTITHASGNAPIPEFEIAGGAAVTSFDANLTLRNDVITRNSIKLPAARGLVFGGAVLANFGSFEMVGTTVSENRVVLSRGGSIFAGAVAAEGNSSVLVEDSKILGNRAEAIGGEFNSVAGGGMRITGFGPVLVTGSEISGNVARVDSGEISGGGMEVFGLPTRIIDDRLVGNFADAGTGSAAGGGLGFSGPGAVTGSVLEANRVRGGEATGGNFHASAGFITEPKVLFSHTSVLHGVGAAGSENCAAVEGATIMSKGFNRESTDQCGFHAEKDEVNVG